MQHAELVTLALLAQQPCHPYELNKQIDAMQVRQWARLGASTVYKVLSRLAEKGLVREKSEQLGARPPRKVYSITRKGRTALKQLVAEGLASPAPAYSDRLVAAVFAGPHSSEAPHQLARTLARLETARQRLRGALERRDLSPVGRIIVEFQTAVIRAEEDALSALADLSKEHR